MITFVIATGNAHKFAEMARILRPLAIKAVSGKDIGKPLSSVEETGATFEENALLKAKAAVKETGLPAVADDSGLCVDALGGAPGVYSARYGGEGASDEERIEKLLYELRDVPKSARSARFVCAIACALPDGRAMTVRGECEGEIAEEPSGGGGFGYDPVFMTEHGGFAELSPEKKDAVSHRGTALRKLSEELPHFLGDTEK
ncbi:MAG TPA: non-canonical purine NTP pyrophosphatase [Ruminococcaceae bacterium]|nr:non-canonical purine NTP pyrophosphatase [Oscillospiraceae bacterium]